MVHSERSREGYLLIDNRLSGGAAVEAATVTCGHCHRQVILNPERTRARGKCRRCDRYLCDGCALNYKLDGGECHNLNVVIEEIRNNPALHNLAEV